MRLFWCVMSVVLGIFLSFFLLAPKAIEVLLIPIQQSGILPQQKDAVQARWEIREDGTMVLLNAAELKEAYEERASSSKPLKLAGFEIFEPGAEKPWATTEFVSRTGVIYLKPMDPFMVHLKASLVLGIFLALPVILYQIYAFVAPGLLPHEKSWVVPCYFGAMVLFPVGAAFAYFLLRFALMFFARYVSPDAYVFNDVRAYLSFALMTMLAFGIVFELPIAILLATRIGLVKTEFLASKRKVIFVVLMIISAVATPTGDPFTLMAMTLPLYGLFEMSLVISRFAERKAQEREEEESLDA